MELQKLEVGKLLKEGVTHYQDNCRFNITDSGCDLFLFLGSPTNKEIEACKDGKISIGFYRDNEVIIMLFKFGDMPWMDAPYSVHLSKSLTEIKPITDGMGLSLNIILTDGNSGIIKAMRLVGLPTRFSRELSDEIKKQKQIPFKNFDVELQKIYMKYKTKDLVKLASPVTKII